jgi:glucokinase
MSVAALGVDIGGSFTKVIALRDDGTVMHRERLPTDGGAARRLPEDVERVIAKVESRLGAAACIGIACPGLVRREGDAVHWMRGRLDVLEGLDWTRALGRSAPVRVINDAQAALAGECALGAGRGCRDVVLLTLGTGVGGAIMCDGHVLSGNIGRAGHLGHIALQVPGEKDIVNTPGSLEDAIGNCTIAARTGGRFTSTAALLAAHSAGDAEASRVWDRSVMLLAAGLASIVNAVDPARVILGGGIASHARDVLLVPLLQWMDEFEWRPCGTGVEIVLAELGEEAGAIGAAAHAREHRT